MSAHSVDAQLELFHGSGSRPDEWAALFARADFQISRNLHVRGWVCPSCQGVTPNLFVLWQDHGLDPDEPHDGQPVCHRSTAGDGQR